MHLTKLALIATALFSTIYALPTNGPQPQTEGSNQLQDPTGQASPEVKAEAPEWRKPQGDASSRNPVRWGKRRPGSKGASSSDWRQKKGPKVEPEQKVSEQDSAGPRKPKVGAEGVGKVNAWLKDPESGNPGEESEKSSG